VLEAAQEIPECFSKAVFQAVFESQGKEVG